MTSKAKRIVFDLFKIYSQEADCLPNEWKLNHDKAKNSFTKNRIITDYIAGMTDRFAINEHKKLYDFNNGLEHLENSQIIFIGDFKKKCLEDNLRIIRFIRFCSLFKSPVYPSEYSSFFFRNRNLL